MTSRVDDDAALYEPRQDGGVTAMSNVREVLPRVISGHE